MIIDAILGTALFFAHNKDEILKQFAFVKRLQIIQSCQIEQTINIGLKVGGNIVELGMGKSDRSIEQNNEYYQKV